MEDIQQFLKLIFLATGANHDCLFAIGQLFETDALIFFYDFGCFLEHILFQPEPIDLPLQLFSFMVKLFDADCHRKRPTEP